MSGTITITTQETVDAYRVSCLLSAAFEGGSNY